MTTGVLACPCEGRFFRTAFQYTEAPAGETRFDASAGGYAREFRRCDTCGHFAGAHAMDLSRLYDGAYVTSTYGDSGLRQAFDRFVALDPSRSDNAGRVARVLAFAGASLPRRGRPYPRSILDVGSGLCVFLHRMKAEGWDGTALDPDARAVMHARDVVGVRAVHGDFMTVAVLGMFDVIALNKVIEHVIDPVAMLAVASTHVATEGFLYVEVPDGETAAAAGAGREEFFVDHWHAFSAASLAMAGARAGFQVARMERLREPSGKYTLCAFLTLPELR